MEFLFRFLRSFIIAGLCQPRPTISLKIAIKKTLMVFRRIPPQVRLLIVQCNRRRTSPLLCVCGTSRKFCCPPADHHLPSFNIICYKRYCLPLNCDQVEKQECKFKETMGQIVMLCSN